MEWISEPQAWIALLTLTALEIVLGIDNIVLISILAGKLPEQDRPRARKLGLALAMLMRILLLFSIQWLMGLNAPLFAVLGQEVTGRDLILLAGGLFLIGKATHEIHSKIEGGEEGGGPSGTASFGGVLVQIALFDLVFSIDSVITAVGMAEHLAVMVIAIVVSVVIMMLSVGAISEFVHRHPTIKMLALAFLLLIGVMLVAEGFHQHVPRGYVYFAMAFSLVVELLNVRVLARMRPRELSDPRLR